MNCERDKEYREDGFQDSLLHTVNVPRSGQQSLARHSDCMDINIEGLLDPRPRGPVPELGHHYYSSKESTSNNSANLHLTPTDGGFHLTLEVPGYSPSNTRVRILGRPPAQQVEVASTTHSDGQFRIRKTLVHLPAEVGAPDGPARLEDGVLTMTFLQADPVERLSVEVPLQ